MPTSRDSYYNANQNHVFAQKVLTTSILTGYIYFGLSMGSDNSISVRLRKSSSQRVLQERCSFGLQFGLGARLAVCRRIHEVMKEVKVLVILKRLPVLISQKLERVHLVVV